MNKQTVITLLLALTAMAGQAKTYKTVKNPIAMAHNIYNGDLKAREVIFTDTATTVHLTLKYPKGQYFQFAKDSYLIDEEGNRYATCAADGIALSQWIKSPESGITDFTMHFEPMPKHTQVFDFIEGDVQGAFVLLGIHDQKTKLKTPTMQQLTKANPWTLPEGWFTTDTVTIKGRIEGYDAEKFGFTSMECYFDDVFDQESTTLVLDIAPDGTFEKRFKTSYPIMHHFIARDTKVQLDEIPFFARPGESIDITVRKGSNDAYEYIYNSGSSRDMQRWLNSYQQLSHLNTPLQLFKGTFAESNQKAENIWQNMLYRLATASRRHQYTPMEMQMALASIQVDFAYAYMSYAMNREYALKKQEKRNGTYHTEIIDSAEWKKLLDHNTYTALHRIDFDNPLLIANNNYPILLNRLQFAEPVRSSEYKDMIDENGYYVENITSARKILTNGVAALRKIMGADKDNMMVQLCTYKNMLSNFNHWRNNEDDINRILADTAMIAEKRKKGVEENVILSKMYPAYLAKFSNPYIHWKAEQLYAYKMAQTELSTPLPNTPMADLIRSLCTKYPGRYLMIDFWGMGCGPCRGAIQHSKQKRAEIAKRNDVKLVFIANEQTAEGSKNYKEYVAEWLADEETVCLTYQDFSRLQELFRFNGIPHYETITPDGRRVRDDLRINGFYSFDSELDKLIERMK